MDIHVPPAPPPHEVSRNDALLERAPAAARVAWGVATRIGTSSLFIGFVLAVASWPGSKAALAPYAGLDGSWQAALAMAAHQGLHFGTQVVWTYGPLGFLTSGQLYYAGTAMLAFVFKLSLATAIFSVFVSALRRYMPLMVAVVAAYFVGYPIAVMWFGSEGVLVLVLVLCIRLLSRSEDAWTARWSWLGFGAIAGLMTLEKLSLGIAIFGLAAIAVAFAPVRRRRLAAELTFGPFFLVFVVGWFGSGNGFGNLFAYVRGAREAAAGYSAISLNPPNLPNDIVLAAIIGVAIVVTAFLHGRSLLRPAASTGAEAEADSGLRADTGSGFTRWTVAGIVFSATLVTWMLFKEGFVRQDGHRLVYFASVPLIVAAFVPGKGSASTNSDADPARSSRAGTLFVSVLLGTTIIALATAGAVPSGLIDPTTSIRGFNSTVRTLASAARRHEVMAGARAAIEPVYGIPPAMLARTAGQTVDIAPVEQTVAWVYPQLRWDPLPTLQDYFAYTPALDKLNVEYIASARAPHFILRQVQSSVDGGLPIFGAPATQVAIYCNYRKVEVSPGWLLLEHTANRCGTMQEVGRVQAVFGKKVTVPNARRGTMVVATFDLHLPVWWSLLDVLYKPPQIWVDLDGLPLPSRFVEATASDLHVLKTASTQGFPAAFSPPRVHTLALTSTGHGHSSYRATITFYEIPVK